MQIIAVDIGNSATKILVGEDHLRIPYQSEGTPIDFDSALATCSALKGPEVGAFWAVVSVCDWPCQQLEEWIKQNRPNDRFELIKRIQVPLEIVESYRSSVGIDRLVAAHAAGTLQQETAPLIVVDAGTAVTIDVVSDNSGKRRFEGGVIFPGAGPGLSLLSSSTANLPNVSFAASQFDGSNSIVGLVGTNTEMAIANGVCLAQAHAAAGIVVVLQKRLPDAEVWITGGGAENILRLLDDAVADQWNADLQLVLRGAISIARRVLSNEQAE